MSIQPYVDAIEWEPLAHPFEADVVRIGEVTGRLGTIRVERDAQYKLSVEIRSTDYAEWTKAHGEGVLGVIFEGVEIEAEDYPGRRIMLKNAVVLNTNHSWGRGGQASTRVDVMVSGVSRALQPAAKASLLVDWFLSGPGYGEMTYWRTTDRERTETFTRTRRGYSEDESEHNFASEKRRLVSASERHATTSRSIFPPVRCGCARFRTDTRRTGPTPSRSNTRAKRANPTKTCETGSWKLSDSYLAAISSESERQRTTLAGMRRGGRRSLHGAATCPTRRVGRIRLPCLWARLAW